MTNELLTEETRRDRWIRLPYALMAMMVFIGGLSYFLDSRARSAATQSAQAKAETFIKQRIAEHDQAAKNPATVAQKSVTPLPVKFTQPARSNVASTISGIFSRINWRGKLAYLKSKPRWVIGTASIVAFLALIVIATRRRQQNAIGLTGLIAEKKAPAIPGVKPEMAKQPVEDAAPCIFSLYSDEETVEEGSFISTYIKPTISTFVESFRSIVKRKREDNDPMHTLIPAVMRSMTTISASPSMAGSQSNSTGNLFRRAVLIRK